MTSPYLEPNKAEIRLRKFRPWLLPVLIISVASLVLYFCYKDLSAIFIQDTTSVHFRDINPGKIEADYVTIEDACFTQYMAISRNIKSPYFRYIYPLYACDSSEEVGTYRIILVTDQKLDFHLENDSAAKRAALSGKLLKGLRVNPEQARQLNEMFPLGEGGIYTLVSGRTPQIVRKELSVITAVAAIGIIILYFLLRYFIKKSLQISLYKRKYLHHLSTGEEFPE